VILLSLLADKLQSPNIQSDYSSDILTHTFIAEGMKQGNTARKFIRCEEQDDLFKRLVLERETRDLVVQSKSDQNLINAFKEFKTWLDETEYSPSDIAKCILEHLGFLFYAPENDKEIGIMFEVINNRGKSLSQLEKIKNYIIYYADKNGISDLNDVVMENWPKILRRLHTVDYTSNDDEDRFLRNCWIVFKDTNKTKSYHVYDNLKEHWPPDETSNWDELKEFVQFMDSASLTYEKFLGLNHITKGERKWLKRIKYHPQIASITPLIIAIFERIQDENIRVKLLELVEKLNFRYYGTGIANRADTGQGELFNYAFNLYNYYGKPEEDTGKIINENWLFEKLRKFISQKANDSAFIQALTLDKDESGNYYHWHGLKFFLASYEEQLRSENRESLDLKEVLAKRNPDSPNDFFHREHIWASNETQYTDEEEEPIMNKRRLGNYILLKETQNIKVSDKPIEEKVELYWKDRKNDPNTLMIRQLKDLYDQAVKDEQEDKHWSRRTYNYWLNIYTRFLDAHEENLVNFALDRWKVEGVKNRRKSVIIDSLTDKNEVYHFEN